MTISSAYTITEPLSHGGKAIPYRDEERIADWRRQLLDALGINGQLMVDVIPPLELIIGPQAPAPKLPLADAQSRLPPGLPIFIGVMMPVMNGWEFLDEVAKDPSLKVIPVVVLTAAERAQVPGAVEVLCKPMDLKALLRAVERYVRGGDDAGD